MYEIIIDPRDIDARYCLRSYFEELGHRFDTGFDPAQSISASDEEMTLRQWAATGRKLYWEQRWDAGRSSFTLTHRTAEVKLMWVAPDVRGLGLGRRLLERLSAEAASRGMVILRLETNRSLSEAKHLYERAGFVEVEPFSNEPYAHHWFPVDFQHKATATPMHRNAPPCQSLFGVSFVGARRVRGSKTVALLIRLWRGNSASGLIERDHA